MHATRHSTATDPKLLAALAVITALAIAAPTTAAPSWTLRGGTSSGQFDGTLGEAVPQTATSGTAGLAMTVPLTSWLSIQPELLWIRKGGRYDVDFAMPANETWTWLAGTYQLDYLELPVVFRAGPSGVSWVRPYVVAGTAAAWRVSGKVDPLIRESPPLPLDASIRFAHIFEGVGTLGSTDHFRRFDVDLIAGTGFAFGRGPITAEIEGRYFHGLIDLLPASFADGHNRTWSVTAGLRVR